MFCSNEHCQLTDESHLTLFHFELTNDYAKREDGGSKRRDEIMTAIIVDVGVRSVEFLEQNDGRIHHTRE